MYQKPKQTPKLSIGLDYWWSDPKQAQKVNQYFRQK
jgi:microcin C transport system substrate-binding protein